MNFNNNNYNKYLIIIISTLLIICILKSYKFKFIENYYNINSDITYIPYWEIKKIRDYEECAWRNIPLNEKTIQISYDNKIIQQVVNKILSHYQKDDFMKQYQYRLYLPNKNIELTIYQNDIPNYSIELDIYRIYVYGNKDIYNKNMNLELKQLKNSQGFKVKVFFTTKPKLNILKVEYLQSIQNQNYFYNLDY
jgi:hypothetical protein